MMKWQIAHSGRALCGAAMIAAFPAAFASAQTALPPEHQMGAVAYRSGGVGQDEAQAMQAAASRYPLQLEFVARMNGGHEAYLAGVEVSIRDDDGRQVLQTTADGPFLLARLPAGHYKVTAKYEDMPRERQLLIPAHGGQRVVFAW